MTSKFLSTSKSSNIFWTGIIKQFFARPLARYLISGSAYIGFPLPNKALSPYSCNHCRTCLHLCLKDHYLCSLVFHLYLLLFHSCSLVVRSCSFVLVCVHSCFSRVPFVFIRVHWCLIVFRSVWCFRYDLQRGFSRCQVLYRSQIFLVKAVAWLE